eukprot:gnl/MRDRNA2_/MRDRNA2_85054_c0_seq1.p1 gnl/MRDRNA2_/MRDRNA2_85054_c0~~gnl/MRDRNA2_/MRDRNA2_85054_c0_seq1.p1  ORF type:complete len:353 (-),score=46.41 gnl/MRDRNA2_/MRDRNA2_85054_c0_seq1:11-1069(-)
MTQAEEPKKMDIIGRFQELQGSSKVAATMAIGAVYISVSWGMIATNSYLMKNDRFPFAPVLSCMHMFTSFFGCGLLYVLCPSMLPAMKDLVFDWNLVLKFVPIGAFFAASVVLSNMSYMYLSVSFIQMLKEANVAMVFILSLIVGLEQFTKTATILLGFITFCTVMSVHGEMNFVLLGLVVQLGSQCFEVSKIVTQNKLMTGEQRLDPCTTVFFMAPMCFLFSCLIYVTQIQSMPPSVVFSHAAANWPFVLLSCGLALALNVVISITIGTLNGVGFLLAAVIKDATIVSFSSLLFGEAVSLQQTFSFSGAVFGVMCYSLFKMKKKQFENDDIIEGFTRVYQEEFNPELLPLK